MTLEELMLDVKSLVMEAEDKLILLQNEAETIDLSLPDFKKASCKRTLYDNYASVVNYQSKLAQGLLQVNHLIMNLKEINQSILDSRAVSYNVTKQYSDKIKGHILVLKDKADQLQFFKNSLDYTLKFYNNLSFILTSPYLREFE